MRYSVLLCSLADFLTNADRQTDGVTDREIFALLKLLSELKRMLYACQWTGSRSRVDTWFGLRPDPFPQADNYMSNV